MSADGLAQKHQPTKPREIDALESVRPGRLRKRNGRMMRVGVPSVRQWPGVYGSGHQGLATVGVKTLYVEPGSPWENGYCESFNGKLREECLNGEIFDSLKEARIVIEQWRPRYNRVRPHAALKYRPQNAGGLYPTWEPGSKVSNHNVIGLTSLGTKSRPGQERRSPVPMKSYGELGEKHKIQLCRSVSRLGTNEAITLVHTGGRIQHD